MKKLLSKRPPRVDVRNLLLCFKWLFIILFYTGCLSFRLQGHELRLSTASIVYTNIIRVLLLTCFIGGAILKLTNPESAEAMFGHLSPVLKFVLILEGAISALTYIQVSVAMDVHKRAHLKLMQRFLQLDKSMKDDFPSISWNYYKSVRKYTPLTKFVIVFYLVVALIYLFNLSNCYCDRLTTLIIATSYAGITAAPGSLSFLHVGVMDLLRLRFRLIRRMLSQHFVARRSYKSQLELHSRIGHLIKYFKHYIELILEVNSVYGYTCAAVLFYDFGILTNMCFLLCQKATESRAPAKEYIFILLFMLPRMYKVTMTAVYGHSTYKEKKKCIQVITTYSDYFPHVPMVRNTLQSFLHWKMHHIYDLTIGRTIRCNLTLLYMTLHGIANYVIILIQLQFQQNNITNRLKSHDMAQDVELIGKRIKM